LEKIIIIFFFFFFASIAMHPPLSKHKHPSCAAQIDALVACHKDNPWMKFLGVCNDSHRAVVHCFKEEKIAKREANKAKAAQRTRNIGQLTRARQRARALRLEEHDNA
jgi:COX assembly mitochondrial protein 2